MKINKPKIERFGQELTLMVKNFIEKEGLAEWIEGIDPRLFKIEKINRYKFLSVKDKHIRSFEPEEDFAIEFLTFVMWATSYTVQQLFLKKDARLELISGLNPHLEENMLTREATLILDVFHREIYKWLEKTWHVKESPVFEEFIGARYQDYYNCIEIWGIEVPSLASGVLVKIIEEKSKQNWIEKSGKTNKKGEIKNIIINRYFGRIFEDIRKLVEDTHRERKN